MKKIIALLLVVLMCLSLAGCNGSTAGKYAKYMTIINALEEKDYEGAVDEIYTLYLADEEAGNIGTDEDEDEDEESEEESSSEVVAEVTAEVEFWLERAPGEYLGYYYDEGNKMYGITVNADKTCTIDGESYTWDFEKNWDGSEYYCDEVSATVCFFDGETEVYRMYLWLNENDYITSSLHTVDAEGNTNYIDAIYYNMSDIQVIELNLENWQDYFELVEDGVVYYDSFGDPSSVRIDVYYLLKEEYGYVLSGLSNVAFEYTDQHVRMKITIDIDELTYEWGEVTYTGSVSDPIVSEMYSQSFEDEPSRYGVCISAIYIDEFPEDEVYQYINHTMTRLQGTIYCVSAK